MRKVGSIILLLHMCKRRMNMRFYRKNAKRCFENVVRH